jgi:hypothetical protein
MSTSTLTLPEIASHIHNTTQLSSADKVSLLSYISTLCEQYTLDTIMQTPQMQMMNVYLNNLISASPYVTAYFLSAHYTLTLDEKHSSTSLITFNIEPIKDTFEYFSSTRINSIVSILDKLTELNIGLILKIHDPYDVGEVIWYNPYTTDMSVRWSKYSGYTVRNGETTRRMFTGVKLYGAVNNG